jgi:hypothetical protein
MPPEPGPAPADAVSRRWVRLTVAAWVVALAAVWVRGLILPNKNSTYTYFSQAAGDWLAGKELYQQLGGSCRYSPTFHVLVTPLALLPDRLGALLWRMLNAGVFLAGMACWVRRLLPGDLGRKQQCLLYLLALPLALGSLNNAQVNPLMTGLILLGLAAAAGSRWNWSAVCITLACLLKIYPVAVGLLLVVVYPRRFAARFVIALAAGLLLPFALRDLAYVARQYEHWYQLLRADNRSDWGLREGYRDLWLLIRLAGILATRAAYQGVQLVTALLVAVLCCWRARPGADRAVVLNTVLGLSACWMTLCGPATESCTYILLAPSLAWALVEAWRRPRTLGMRLWLGTSYGLFLASFVANWFPGVTRLHALGTHPLGALLLLAALAWDTATRHEDRAASPYPALRDGTQQAA